MIADLLPGCARSAGRQLGRDFIGLLADFCQHRQGIVPVETDLAGLFLELERAHEGGEGDRNARKHPAAALAGAIQINRPARSPLGFLLRLDLIPQRIDGFGIETTGVAEHVRMAPYQLFRDGPDHVAELKQARLLGHPGVKHHLQQQVAKLVAQIVEVTPFDRIRDLIGFLDGVGRNGEEILRQIPRAARAGRAQRRHDLDETRDIARRSGIRHVR